VDLIRLGSNYDGGYVVSRDAIISSEVLVSLGIANDVNFEYDFVAINGCRKPAFMYDKTTNHFSLRYLVERFGLCLKFKSPRPFWSYLIFIWRLSCLKKSGSILVKKFVRNSAENDSLSLSQVLGIFDSKTRVFLKIDIEGDEYSLLKEIISFQSSINGMVIEFHNASSNWDTIRAFISELDKKKLLLDHLHLNNYGSISSKGLPNVIELSFSRTPSRQGSVDKLPSMGLDFPNSPLKRDFEVLF
jgi:hypothetical protein